MQDLDQDTLAFSTTGLPDNATLPPNAQYGTATVEWAPTATDNGNAGAGTVATAAAAGQR